MARPGSVLAQRKCTSFSEPRMRALLKCPNLDLLGGRGRPRGAAPRLKHRVGTPDGACCVARWGRIICFVLMRLHTQYPQLCAARTYKDCAR